MTPERALSAVLMVMYSPQMLTEHDCQALRCTWPAARRAGDQAQRTAARASAQTIEPFGDLQTSGPAAAHPTLKAPQAPAPRPNEGAACEKWISSQATMENCDHRDQHA